MSDYFGEEFEDIFKLITIDRIRKKKMSVRLVDAEGDEVPFKHTIKQIMQYLSDKMSVKKDSEVDIMSTKNQIANQILPLITQAMVSGLPEAVGDFRAAQLLTVDGVRWPIINMMLLSFSLLKLIQDKKFKIVTTEEDVSDFEMEKLAKFSRISEAATIGAMHGKAPKDLLKELLASGDISSEELSELTGGKGLGDEKSPLDSIPKPDDDEIN